MNQAYISLMKTIMTFFLTACTLGSTSLLSQDIDFSDDFMQKLKTTGVDFMAPLDTDYKDVMVLQNSWLDYDFAIRSRKEKLELRYLIEPWNDSNPMSSIPSIQFTRLITHLATNDQEAVIAIHRLSSGDLELFNADWGKVAFFQPKKGFADKLNCKLLSLYREGQGMAHVLFLYNKPTEAVDNRFYALRFRGENELN